MAAAYDTYDYPAYWEEREYEYDSEVLALRAFLNRIPKIGKFADIGGGYGRLVEYYQHRASKIDLVDPSGALLKVARKRLVGDKGMVKKINFVQASVENLGKKKRKNSYDVAIMVRVMHHIEDPQKAMRVVGRLVKPGGYLILEFPNKVHLKALVMNFIHGNFTYLLDIFPTDRRSRRNIKKRTLPFLNFHPDVMMEGLRESGFKVIEKRSVSNLRNVACKKYLPLPFLLWVEERVQRPLSAFNFGPSVFILAKKIK